MALYSTVQLHATKPQDHVYGILGLVPDQQVARVGIDYSKSSIQVFRDAMTVVWTSGAPGAINGLMSCFDFGTGNHTLGLPTWVPDLSRQSVLDDYNGMYFSVRRTAWRPGRKAELHIEGDVMTLKALQFDRISDSMEFIWMPTRTDRDGLQVVRAMAQRARSTTTPANRLAAFSNLRDKAPIWTLLTSPDLGPNAGGSETGEYLDEVVQEIQGFERIVLEMSEVGAFSPRPGDSPDAFPDATISPVRKSIERKTEGKKFFMLESRFVGIGTKPIDVGDIIVFVVGMRCMYVLRPFQDGYHMVGFAEISGLMNWDELDQAIEASSLEEEELKIY